MILEKAKVSDLPGIFGLLRDSGLPFDGSAQDLSHFFVVKEGREIIGCAGLEVHGKVGLLNSFAVKKEQQGQGLGKTLINRMFDLARNKGLKKIYLLTIEASQYFSKFGFEQVEWDEIDPAIPRTKDFIHCCSCSAVPMVKHLDTKERNVQLERLVRYF